MLRGGRVADGSRVAARQADVRVSGNRIVAIGDRLDTAGAREIDLDGLCLAPGFIDVHTHFDAQVFWDPGLTPSSWHGVTTVIAGNCGLGVAPVRPENQRAVMDALGEVEGIPSQVLEAGVDWESFRSFESYLDSLERLPKLINVASLIGHTPLRIDVMGDAAWERAATGEEIQAMRSAIASALRAGAKGFSTSRNAGQVGPLGQPIPSRLATDEELFSLCDVLRDERQGVIEMPLGTNCFIEQFAALSKRTGRPVTWAGLFTESDFSAIVDEKHQTLRSQAIQPRGTTIDVVDRAAALGGQVFGQVHPRPNSMRIRMADPFIFVATPGFDEVMAAVSPEARAAIYADPVWRDKARAATHHTVGSWSKIRPVSVDKIGSHEYERLGPPLSELAAEKRVDPFDLLLDISLANQLEAVFKFVLFNQDEGEVEELLRDPRTVVGNSDAGAHVNIVCESTYPTYLLGRFVREKQALSLETAIWRMTGQPAAIFGLVDRGFIREGYIADMIAFDLDTVRTCDTERVYDLPGGALRLVEESKGIEYVWVGGTAIRSAGKALENEYPGVVVRR